MSPSPVPAGKKAAQPTGVPPKKPVGSTEVQKRAADSARPSVESKPSDKRPATPGGTTASGAPSSTGPPPRAAAASGHHQGTSSGSSNSSASLLRTSTPPVLKFGTGPGTYRTFDPAYLRKPDAALKEHLAMIAAMNKKQLAERPAAPIKQPDATKK